MILVYCVGMKTTKQTVRIAVENWAQEDAERDLAFVGNAPFAGMTPDKAAEVRAALVFYAKRGAVSAFNGLDLHGHLSLP